jgi:hypothetical protein
VSDAESDAESDADGEAGFADEAVFELADWSSDERRDLTARLEAHGITHQWEEGDLVVAEADANAVEEIIEAVEYPDELAPASEEDDDGGAGYAVMSDLYVVADRLQNNPDDPALAGRFYEAADAAAAATAPFGVGPDVWQQVQELAASVCEQMEGDADDDVIARDAAALRHLLSRYV